MQIEIKPIEIKPRKIINLLILVVTAIFFWRLFVSDKVINIASEKQFTIDVEGGPRNFSLAQLIKNYNPASKQLVVGGAVFEVRETRKVSWSKRHIDGTIYEISGDYDENHYQFSLDIATQTITPLNSLAEELLALQDTSLNRVSVNRPSGSQGITDLFNKPIYNTD